VAAAEEAREEAAASAPPPKAPFNEDNQVPNCNGASCRCVCFVRGLRLLKLSFRKTILVVYEIGRIQPYNS
jgi:hypothetical protein